MKKFLLFQSLFVLLFSFNSFSQSGWQKKQNVVTGESFLVRDGIKEDGSPDAHGFKIWKSGDSYYFTIVHLGSYLGAF
jgi:hypothetical protein